TAAPRLFARRSALPILRHEQHGDLGMLQQGLGLRSEHEALPGVSRVSRHANQIGARAGGVLPDAEPRRIALQNSWLALDASRLEILGHPPLELCAERCACATSQLAH